MEAWSASHNLRMIVRTDHGTDDEEYEEIIAFHRKRNRSGYWLMWRDAETVWLQSALGRSRGYVSVADAIATMVPERRRIVGTDISTTKWAPSL
jgi:hypothetical protein